MKYKRYIDVKNQTVHFTEFDSVLFDCSSLEVQNIAFVVETYEGDRWVERVPFKGRETDFDFSSVEWMFTEAKERFTQGLNNPIVDDKVNEITPLQGMLALNEVGLGEVFQAWATSPDRTVLEKAYLQYAQRWVRTDPILASAAQAFGFSEEQLDDLFRLAKTL